jgi:hypothetical protein
VHVAVGVEVGADVAGDVDGGSGGAPMGPEVEERADTDYLAAAAGGGDEGGAEDAIGDGDAVVGVGVACTVVGMRTRDEASVREGAV